MNPNDPIAQNPDAARELFEQLGQVCRGFPTEAVITAALNLVVNAQRMQNDTRQKAERSWDETATRAKEHLMSCYDSTGRKKGVFPYTQHVAVPLIRL